MLELILIGLGALLALGGFLVVAPQVRIHAIRPGSAGGWIFRLGTLMLIVGQLLLDLDSSLNGAALGKIGAIMGLTCIIGYITIIHHEWQQAGETFQPGFVLKDLLPLLILALASFAVALVLIILLVVGVSGTLVVVMLGGLIALTLGLCGFVAFSPETRRAKFAFGRSLSLQMALAGLIIVALALPAVA